MNLFSHQHKGVSFLTEREGALLAWEMGTGKTRTALEAARHFFDARGKVKIDRVLVLCPASVKFAWREELKKLSEESSSFDTNVVSYKKDKTEWKFFCSEVLGTMNGNPNSHMPVAIISYSIVQNKEHAERIAKWCAGGRTILICDESSYLKYHTAKQSKHTKLIAKLCSYRWLLSGTPITNGPLDLWGQAEVMCPVDRQTGPLHDFTNYMQFRAVYAELYLRTMGKVKFWKVTGYKNLDKLTKRFEPFTSRVEKKDCFDLPEKTYTIREVQLLPETWTMYQELKRNCLLTLNGEQKPEPDAAVRLLRLAQITSGHAAAIFISDEGKDLSEKVLANTDRNYLDVSSEKIDWLVEALTEGELEPEGAVIVWCRWRRERERLFELLKSKVPNLSQIFGGQTERQRSFELQHFCDFGGVLLAQPHAGGFGLNLTIAHTAVYMSNDYSWAVRAQSEDRMHRAGQKNPCLYVDVLATGPGGQKTIDHVILEALKEKNDLATWTCSRWRKALE